MTPPDTRFWFTVGGFAVLHLSFAILLPVSGDEAYHWGCSRHLDWAYFDQPPLMIWPIALLRHVFGDTNLAVRGPAIIASFLIAIFLRALVRRLGGTGDHAAFAYAILHGMPLFFLGSFYQSTDIGLAAAYLAGTVSAVAIAQGQRRAWWWFGVAMGLGFLAKFPIVLLLPALLPILADRDRRRDLATPAPWLAAMLAAGLTAPVWIWGSQHGWDNLTFQIGRASGAGGLRPGLLAEFVGANLVLATPPLFAAMAIALWRFRPRDTTWRVVLVAAAAPLLIFGTVALWTRVGAHWGAPGFVPAVAVLVLTPFPGRRRLIAAGVAIGILISALALAVVAFPRPLMALELSYPGRPQRISTAKLSSLIGNHAIVEEIVRRRRPNEVVLASSYAQVHLFAYLSGGRLDPRLAHLAGGKHGLASLYWFPAGDLVGRDAMVVTERDVVADRLPSVCREIVEEDPIEIIEDRTAIRTVRVFRCLTITRDDGVFSR